MQMAPNVNERGSFSSNYQLNVQMIADHIFDKYGYFFVFERSNFHLYDQVWNLFYPLLINEALLVLHFCLSHKFVLT